MLNKIREIFKSKKYLLRGYPDPVLNLDCTEFEVDNWVISDFILKELVPIVGIRPFPLNELVLMVAAVCRLRPTHIFEWGTHLGKSARIFYETSRKFKIGVEIHSIDLPDDVEHVEHPKNQRGVLVKNITDVKLYQGDGLSTSLEIYRSIKDKFQCRPLLFLDGDHEYESVKRELRGVIDNVPNANIIVHDTFYQSPNSGYNIGPHQAFQDVLPELRKKGYKTIGTSIGLPGMILVYKQ